MAIICSCIYYSHCSFCRLNVDRYRWIRAKYKVIRLRAGRKWCFQVKCSSIYMPRNFVVWSLNFAPIWLSGVPFIETTFSEMLNVLPFRLGAMHFVLVGFRDKQLAQNQSSNSAKLEFVWLNISFGLESKKYTDVSSTKDSLWLLVKF